MTRGDLKQMKPRYLRGATYNRYGTTLYVGVGIPIPVINSRVAQSAALSDDRIFTNILDYGIPSRSRPIIKKVSYGDLKLGKVVMNGRNVPASPLSSFKYAKEIADTLKRWIKEGLFFLTRPAELLPNQREFKPLEVRRHELRVKDIMTVKVTTAKPSHNIKTIADLIVRNGVDHVPIVDDDNRLVGIVTSWDLAKALAQGKSTLEEVMTRKVVTARENETGDLVARRLAQHKISGVPVVDDARRVIGIVTTDDLAKFLRRWKE